MSPGHLKLDVSLDGSRSVASHNEACPEIGPICAQRAEPPQQHHTTLWAGEVRLLAEYGLRPGLAVQAALPLRLIDTRTRYTNLLGNPIVLDYVNIHHRDETLMGLGDGQLLLHGARRAFGLQFGLRAGANLPFGIVHENPERLTTLGLPHEHIQLGTGTVDPLVGADAALALGPATLAVWTFAQVPLYQGSTGYRAGARFSGGLVGSTTALGPVALRLGAELFHERPERWDGLVPTDDGNQGRTDIYLAPGATWTIGDWTLTGDLRVRLWGQTVGAQLQMPVVLAIGVGRLLHLESGMHTDAAPSDDDGDAEADVVDAVQAGELAPLSPSPGKWTVFDFWAPWCEACKVLDAGLRKLAAERAGVAVRRVNIVDFDSPIALRELPGVSVLPHVRLVDAKGSRAYEASGPADQLLSEVERRTKE